MAEGYLGKIMEGALKTSQSALLYCKTNIAGYFFDGFLDVSHDSQLEITSNQIETGVSIVDHAYMKPLELSMTILVSDVHQSLIPGQFSQGWRRHTSAWQVLKSLQVDRIPVSVFTKLGLYDNMLIQSLSAVDTDQTISSLKVVVKLREVPIATLKTVKISQADQTTSSTEVGNVMLSYLSSLDYSTLAQIFGAVN